MEFYGSASAYQAYHLARGRDDSARSDADVETALLVASEWLDAMYSWPGHIYRTDPYARQARAWPRSEAYDRDGFAIDYRTVPVEVERATYEVAYRWLTDPSVLTPDFTPEKYRRVSIDGALSVEFRGLDAAQVQKQFPALGVVLAPLLGGSNASSLSVSTVRV